MRKTSRSYSCPRFRIRTSKNLSGRRTLWLGSFCGSYVNAANTPEEARKLAKELRAAADWVEKEGTEYLAEKNEK